MENKALDNFKINETDILNQTTMRGDYRQNE